MKVYQVAFAPGITVRGTEASHKDLRARKHSYPAVDNAFLAGLTRIEPYFLNTGLRAFQQIVDMPVTLLILLPQMAR